MISMTYLFEEDPNWIQDAKPKKGLLHQKLGVPQDEKIPQQKLQSIKDRLHNKAEKGSLAPSELKLSREVNFAINAQG